MDAPAARRDAAGGGTYLESGLPERHGRMILLSPLVTILVALASGRPAPAPPPPPLRPRARVGAPGRAPRRRRSASMPRSPASRGRWPTRGAGPGRPRYRDPGRDQRRRDSTPRRADLWDSGEVGSDCHARRDVRRPAARAAASVLLDRLPPRSPPAARPRAPRRRGSRPGMMGGTVARASWIAASTGRCSTRSPTIRRWRRDIRRRPPAPAARAFTPPRGAGPRAACMWPRSAATGLRSTARAAGRGGIHSRLDRLPRPRHLPDLRRHLACCTPAPTPSASSSAPDGTPAASASRPSATRTARRRFACSSSCT